MADNFEYPKPGDEHKNSSYDDLVDVIKKDYLIGIATLVGDFHENIQFLISQRVAGDADAAKKASEELLGLLFPSVKDPKQIQFPSLDIDAVLDAMNKSG